MCTKLDGNTSSMHTPLRGINKIEISLTQNRDITHKIDTTNKIEISITQNREITHKLEISHTQKRKPLSKKRYYKQNRDIANTK